MAFPDYRLVPYAQPPRGTRAYDLWQIWGNLHDGNQGERIPPGIQFDDDGFPFGSDQPLTQERFERWWKRNPLHNWTNVVQRRPVLNPRYIWGKPTGDLRAEVNKSLVLRYDPFFLKIGDAFIGWMSIKPPWPAPAHWVEADPSLTLPGGGALNVGAKSLSWFAPVPSPPVIELEEHELPQNPGDRNA